MKANFYLLVALLMVSGALFLSSCKEDDNDPDSPIVGVWSYESADVSLEINGQDILDYLIEEFEMTAAQAEVLKTNYEDNMNNFDGMSWEFKSDGTFKVTSPEGNETGTWSLSSDNKKLTLTSAGESDVIDVKSLSSSKMEIFYEEEFEEDMNEDAVNEVFTASIDLTLTK